MVASALLFLLVPRSFAGEASDDLSRRDGVEQVVAEAVERNLAGTRAWRKLLLIPDRRVETDESIVDDPAFFFATEGKSDPAAELTATLRAFANPPVPGGVGPENAHPQCRFPARRDFLRRQLGPAMDQIPMQPCPDLEEFLSVLRYKAVSLVFSNYDPSNPGSMFGHTFLRLHRDLGDAQKVALLDDIANFSAFVSDAGSLVYPIKGLFGGYKGKFALMPYYRKIQEYSNYESRDLWEYRLALDENEVRLLELMLWELGGTYIDYFYFDDNCSFVMLQLLEAAKPSLALTEGYYLYAIPADTVRTVYRAPGLVEAVKARPSARSRFVGHYRALSVSEQAVFHRVIDAGAVPDTAFEGMPPEVQARIVDALLEYIDFEEKLAGDRKPLVFTALRSQLLTARAESGVKTATRSVPPLSTAPHLGHDSSYVQLLAGGTHGASGAYSSIAELTWKPALHELLSRSEGYSDELQIGMFETVVEAHSRAERVAVRLKSARFFEITALPRRLPLVDNYSWRFDSGYESGIDHGAGRDVGRGMLVYGVGKAFHLGEGEGAPVSYGLLQADLGYASQSFGLHLGPTALLGFASRLGERTKLKAEASLARRFFDGGRMFDDVRTELTVAHSLSSVLDARLKASAESGILKMALGCLRYF